jgi:hypothetical protein
VYPHSLFHTLSSGFLQEHDSCRNRPSILFYLVSEETISFMMMAVILFISGAMSDDSTMTSFTV